MTIRLIFLLLAATPLTAGLSPKPAYQPIIDAKPFGDMAAQRTETDSATQAAEQKRKEEIAGKFRMCGITDMPDGSRRIAFLDETSGQPESYLLGVGESQNGFTLTEADYSREYATLTKDGLTFTLGLGKGLIDRPPEAEDDAGAAGAAGASDGASELSAAVGPTPAPAVRAYASPRALPGAAPQSGSFRSRLLKRRADEAKAEAAEVEALKLKADTLLKEKTLRERREQIERIKQGLAPTVPIKLTPEEDAELEAAGAFGRRDGAPEEGKPPEESPQGRAPQEGTPPETPDTPAQDKEVRGSKPAGASVA